ncbi:MAG: hypothetical protein QW270_05120 [Candidatus Bathyarchaeia archaeon]
MPVPKALVTRYFQLLVNRQFTEAERELERIKQKMHKTEWNRGYFRGLYGMLIVRRSTNNDSYAFLSKLDLNDKASLRAYKREFSNHVKNRLHGEFDRGFFLAWADCMSVLSRVNIANNPNANTVATASENLKGSKGQVTMEKFLDEKA